MSSSLVQLIFASGWIDLERNQSGSAQREFSHELRCNWRIRLARGRQMGMPAMWIDWAPVQPRQTPFKPGQPDSHGLSVALAAAVEASPDAEHWLLLLSHLSSPRKDLQLEALVDSLEGNTMVAWFSANNDLLAAGFSCELYSELIRLDCANALTRLLRRYPCLQVGAPGFLARRPGTFTDR